MLRRWLALFATLFACASGDPGRRDAAPEMDPAADAAPVGSDARDAAPPADTAPADTARADLPDDVAAREDGGPPDAPAGGPSTTPRPSAACAAGAPLPPPTG